MKVSGIRDDEEFGDRIWGGVSAHTQKHTKNNPQKKKTQKKKKKNKSPI